MADIDVGTRNFINGIGQGGAAQGGDDDAAKMLGYLTGVKSSKGIDYYNTQSPVDKPIMPGSRGVSFGFAKIFEMLNLSKYLTKDSAPVHANETAALSVSPPPIEPSSNNANFADLIGERMGSYAVADIAGGAPVAPMPIGGGRGGFELS